MRRQEDDLIAIGAACADQLIIVIDADGNRHAFEINPLRKERLVKGLDDIDVTQGYATQIATVESRRRTAYPWLPVTSQA